MTLDKALEIVEKVLDYARLNKVQEIVCRQSWEGLSYSEIAASAGYEPEYIKQVCFHLWQSLSKAFDLKVTKNNFQSILKRYAQQTQMVAAVPATSLSTTDDVKANGQNPKAGGLRGVPELGDAIAKRGVTASLTTRPRQDWGDAINASVFYGRTTELLELEQWIVQERCRLVTILDMGGIGKTVLCVKLAERIQEHFE